MLTITHYDVPPPASVGMQIVEMAAEYLTDISLAGTPPSNALYPVHQAALAMELGIYLNAMGAAPDRPIKLLVAADAIAPTEVLGFLKYLPLQGVADACGVTYMAVRKSHRRQGVARALMAELLVRHPHTELSCFVEKVPFYERLGFQVIGVRDTQVRMCTRDKSADGIMAVLSTAELMDSSLVSMVQQAQLQKVGAKAMRDAERQFVRHIEQRTRQATAFVEARRGA